MTELPPRPEGIVLAHFIVSADVERSRRFYTEVAALLHRSTRRQGGFSGEPTYVALSNSWIIINGGGGLTDDKPTVTLEAPRDPNRVSSFNRMGRGSDYPGSRETSAVGVHVGQVGDPTTNPPAI